MFAWVTKTFYYQKCLTSVQSLPNRSCLTDRNCLRNKSLLSISKVRPHLGLGCTRTKLKQHKITYHLVSSMLPAGQSFRASIYLKSAHQSGRFKLNIAKSKLLGNSFPFFHKILVTDASDNPNSAGPARLISYYYKGVQPTVIEFL